jgi:cellulose synthase/poly-beta-1,6-N-acetylglucosamine synthase-like glycosyltransferase
MLVQSEILDICRCSIELVDVTIGIASFNEAQNIGGILDALIAQKGNDEIKIVQIIVSDDSCDGTERVVNGWARRDRRIRLLHHSSRRGKHAALNEIFAHSRGKIVVLFDADVLPADDRVVLRLVSPMVRDPNIGVCGGAPCALETKKLMGRVAYFTFKVWDNVRRTLKGGSNFFSVHGKIMAVSSVLSRSVRIPAGTIGDDAYIYLSCVMMGLKVHFVSDAIVYYQETQNLHDYLIRRYRYERNLTQIIGMFGNLAIRELAIPRSMLVACTLKEAPRDPLSLIIATTLVVWSKLYYRAAKVAPLWSIAASTKAKVVGQYHSSMLNVRMRHSLEKSK